MVKYSRVLQDETTNRVLAPTQTRLREKQLAHNIKDKINKLDGQQMEELTEEKKKLEKAGKYMADERKWINEVVARVDIVPDEGNYYDKLPVKPGFDFFYALINCSKDKLEHLKILIPETLYFNQISYLF